MYHSLSQFFRLMLPEKKKKKREDGATRPVSGSFHCISWDRTTATVMILLVFMKFSELSTLLPGSAQSQPGKGHMSQSEQKHLSRRNKAFLCILSFKSSPTHIKEIQLDIEQSTCGKKLHTYLFIPREEAEI